VLSTLGFLNCLHYGWVESPSFSILRAASAKSASFTMLQRLKTAVILSPLIFIATTCGTPQRMMFLAALLRKSWTINPGNSTVRVKFNHACRKSQSVLPGGHYEKFSAAMGLLRKRKQLWVWGWSQKYFSRMR